MGVPDRPATYFKYVTAEVARTILVSQRLRWSSPLLFNDIFDVPRELDLGFGMKDLDESVSNEIRRLISSEQAPSLIPNSPTAILVSLLRGDDRINVRNTILSEVPHLIEQGSKVARNSFQELKNRWSEYVPTLRILCLSSIHDNLLMWSHYADSHKGAVLELQCLEDSAWLLAQPVIYQAKPPTWFTIDEWTKILTGQKTLDLGSAVARYTCTKGLEWAYEKEWRVVDLARQGEKGIYSDGRFDPRELRSVYLGCDISEKDKADIASFIRGDLSHVQVWRGKKLERERRILFERTKL